MAERKPLFMDDTAGFSEEMTQADTATFGGLTLGGDVVMAGNLLTGLGPAATYGDAVSWGQGGPVVFSGLDLSNQKIENLASPTIGGDAANKTYVDSVAQGLDIHDSVIVATTGPLTLASDFENGDVVDGVTLATGDRILIKDQANGIENGIYVVKATGTPDRAVDWAIGYTAAGAFTFVESGDVGADNGFVCTNDTGSDVTDTDALTFSQFSGAGQITAGDGLYKDGNTIHAGAGLGIDLDADAIKVQLGASNPGLEFTAQSGVQVKAGDGVELTLGGVAVDLVNTAAGLEFSGGELQVQVSASGALERVYSGVQVKIDDTPNTLDMDADGLKVVGLPSLFEINDVATNATVDAAALNVVTGGPASDADGEHTHNAFSPTAHTHSHASTTGQTADDHHAELHSVASHNDTTATGAELDQLTDGSDAAGLHVHGEADITMPHSGLLGITSDDHHAQVHDLTSGDHTESGLTVGHVLTATGAGTFGWQFAPSASEAQRVENDIVVNEAIAVGDPVYWSAVDDRVAQADAGVNAKAYVFGVAITAQPTPGSTTPVVSMGEAVGAITGLGATVGDNVYLANGGGLALSPQNGKRVIRVGIAMNANDLWVEIIDYGKKAS